MEPVHSVNLSHWEVNDKKKSSMWSKNNIFSSQRSLKIIIIFLSTSTPHTCSVLLGVPQLLEGMFVQSTKVYLSWREVPCVQNSYVARFYPTCGTDRDVQWSQSVVTTGVTVNGLAPITEYTFQVAVVNANITGPFSEPITLGGK